MKRLLYALQQLLLLITPGDLLPPLLRCAGNKKAFHLAMKGF
ncbi:MAG: hypothetical protein RR855_16395 [Comamonas sp.]